MDLINYICQRAAVRFGDPHRFNAACFSSAWKEVTGLADSLDGRAVAAMLHGRDDVEPLGGAHYALRPLNPERP